MAQNSKRIAKVSEIVTAEDGSVLVRGVREDGVAVALPFRQEAALEMLSLTMQAIVQR